MLSATELFGTGNSCQAFAHGRASHKECGSLGRQQNALSSYFCSRHRLSVAIEFVALYLLENLLSLLTCFTMLVLCCLVNKALRVVKLCYFQDEFILYYVCYVV